MNAYYDRVEEKVVTEFDLSQYDKGALDEEAEAQMKERAERYEKETARLRACL